MVEFQLISPFTETFLPPPLALWCRTQSFPNHVLTPLEYRDVGYGCRWAWEDGTIHEHEWPCQRASHHPAAWLIQV